MLVCFCHLSYAFVCSCVFLCTFLSGCHSLSQSIFHVHMYAIHQEVNIILIIRCGGQVFKRAMSEVGPILILDSEVCNKLSQILVVLKLCGICSKLLQILIYLKCMLCVNASVCHP